MIQIFYFRHSSKCLSLVSYKRQKCSLFFVPICNNYCITHFQQHMSSFQADKGSFQLKWNYVTFIFYAIPPNSTYLPPLSLDLCLFSQVRVIFILTESIRNRRNIICCIGTRTDVSGWIVNPSSHKGATAVIVFLKQISKISPNNSDLSIHFTDNCPFDLRYLNREVKTFIKILTGGENPLGKIIYWHYSPFQCNFRYFE